MVQRKPQRRIHLCRSVHAAGRNPDLFLYRALAFGLAAGTQFAFAAALLRELAGLSRFRPCGLALRAEMGAASRHDDAADDRAAAITFLAVVLVGAMFLLKLAAAAVEIHVIRNGGAAQANRLAQNVLHRAMQPAQFVVLQPRANFFRMDLRAPQTFIGVD